MISQLGNRLNRLSERFMPDPFVFALLLTLLTFLLGLTFGDALAGHTMGERVTSLFGGWYADFFGSKGLMKFALQMCIVLITGHAIAMSAPVRRAIEKVTTVASTPKMAAAVVALVACLASLLQWGLGAITGAFLAREMGRAFARRGEPVHYPLLGAAGYAGFLVWHGGLSGSAPLKIAEPGHSLEDKIGVISVADSLFGPLNITVTIVMLIVVTAVFYALMPTDASEMTPFTGTLDDDETEDEAGDDPRAPIVRMLESSRVLSTVVAVWAFGVVAYWFSEKGLAGWDLDSINLIFLALGLLLHPSPVSYVRAVADGARGAAGIILQFPFYFGILGLLKASGLIVQIAAWFISISSATTYPLFTFLSAGVVNFFVPSGGGQWAVQGPVMIEAVSALGVDPVKVVMALAYGDAWTNMLQPFWALPLLGIMGLRARDIIGYTAFLMIVTGPIFLLLLALF